jgi:2-C-methyl-D-erythritol 2,4-cyclodiphosphate synthase
LILGGVTIPSEHGAVGHSDADALAHAVTDAILGALSLGDIGSHFPDSDPQWKAADSFTFLAEAARLMGEKGYRIGNIDAVIHLETPKLRPFIDAMRTKLASVLQTEIANVSVKAKTGEGLDAVGRGEAVKAECVALLQKAA